MKKLSNKFVMFLFCPLQFSLLAAVPAPNGWWQTLYLLTFWNIRIFTEAWLYQFTVFELYLISDTMKPWRLKCRSLGLHTRKSGMKNYFEYFLNGKFDPWGYSRKRLKRWQLMKNIFFSFVKTSSNSLIHCQVIFLSKSIQIE